MKKIIELFVHFDFYPKIAVAIIFLAGGYGMLSLKKSYFPETEARFITVSVAYPGASPKEMEEGITSRIEEALRGIVGIREITSTSSENFATVSIETTGKYDLDETLMEVKNAIDGINSFPTAAERPVVYKQRSISQAARMTLAGDVDLLTLKKYANEIEEDLKNSGVISQVQITGFPALEISIELSEETLMRYGITFDDISRAVVASNQDISAGQIRNDDEEVLIRSRNRSTNPDDIADIVVRANPDGSNIRIRDIGSVKIQFAEESARGYMNGKIAINFAINKLPEEDLDDVIDFTLKYVDEFNTKTESAKLTITFNYLNNLYSRLNLLVSNGLQGFIYVLIALGLFLNLRLSFWVAWGIPSSFLMMFMAASLMGITINMMSLFGMILVVGILVDDGIVIAENIYSHYEMGKTPKQAAIDGATEVLPSIITSVLTTVVAFMPILFLEGRMEIMHEMAMIVILSLLFSLVEAMFILPAHLASERVLRRMERQDSKFPIRTYLDKFIFFLRNKLYSKILHTAIKWKWVTATVPIAMIIVTIGMFKGGVLSFTFFPSLAFDFFNINVAFTPGSGEKRTMEYLQSFEQSVWDVNEELKAEFKDTAEFITYTFSNIGNAFDGKERGAHAGNIFVILRDMEGAPISSFDVAKRVQEKIGPVPEANQFTVGSRSRWGAPVSISILSRDLVALDAAKELLKAELRKYPQLQNVLDNNSEGKQEILIELKPKAFYLGLNHASIASQVRQGFYGGQIQRLQSGKDELRVWVRYPKTDRLNIGQLESMKIKTPAGDFPLSELATLRVERGPVSIIRFNGQREVRVEADLLNPNDPVPPILASIEKDVIPKVKELYPSVRFMAQGQQRENERSTGDLRKYFSISFIIIFLILIIHFRSVGQALLILSMIPLALLGALWGHGFHGMSVSMLSIWGMVALAGVAVNDSVVFLDRFNQNVRSGMKIMEAVYETGLSRFRPIILTSLTTVAGLYPLILEKSFQAQFLIPMAVSLAYGIMFGTIFTLIFFPVIILLYNDLKFYWHWFWHGEKVLRETLEVAYIESHQEEETRFEN